MEKKIFHSQDGSIGNDDQFSQSLKTSCLHPDKSIKESLENDKIIGQILVERVLQSRKSKYPDANTILNEIGDCRVVFK